MLKKPIKRLQNKKNHTRQINVNNIFNPSYERLKYNLDFLDCLNKTIPQSLRKRQMINFDKDDIQNFGITDLIEANNFNKFLLPSLQKSTSRSIKITSEKVIKKLIDKYKSAYYVSEMNSFIREMSLVYTITVFEQYLSEILINTLKLKPEIMKSSKKQITYEELFSFKDFDGIKEHIAEREINTMINQDIEKVNSNLIREFKLDLSKNRHWSKFKEYFHRRHIIIHNNNFPDKKYRKKTGYKGKQKRLSVTPYYLANCIKLFREYSKTIKDFFTNKFISITLRRN